MMERRESRMPQTAKSKGWTRPLSAVVVFLLAATVANAQDSQVAQGRDSSAATVEYISGGVKHTHKIPADDGDSGAAAEVAARLMQLQKNDIVLLPDLPKEWSSGRVQGLHAPNGFNLDFAWQDGRLTALTIHSKDGNPCRVRYGDRGDTALIKLEETKAGESYTLDDRFRFSIEDDTKRGRLHVKDMDKAILTYNYGMQLNTGAEEKYERGCYIHPLWDVNGWQRTVTEDFPPLDGHLHHRGLGWTWPSVKVRGLKVQTWHPSDPPLRQHFVKWLRREAGKDHATVAVENAWLLDDKEKVMTETVEIVMHPLRTVTRVRDERPNRGSWDVNSRAIDLKLTFEAVGGPIEISGGYGGLLLRGSADMKGGVITTEQGPLTGDGGGPHPWADMTPAYEQPANTRGVAIFTPADHPPHPPGARKGNRPQTPPRWLLRTSYGGLMNVSWPGSSPYTLEPGKPLLLEYRIYVHEGNTEVAQVAEAYAEYLEQRK